MKQHKILLAILALPQLAFAQASLQTFLPDLVKFVSNVLIPFLFAIAFFIFVFATFKYFVLESASEEGREKAKNLALYTILAFVFLIIFWGLVNILSKSIGLEAEQAPCPDYIQSIDPTLCP